jgi:hypothetical protein
MDATPMNPIRAHFVSLLCCTLLAALCAPAAGALTLSFDDVGLVHGSLVSDAYAGVVITADNFARPFDYAVAFDSRLSSTRDPDLEAGSGGATRWSGGNLEGQELGLMLILQENSTGCQADGICNLPDDEGRRPAGTFSFTFSDASVLDFGFDLVDVENTNMENGAVTFFSGTNSHSIDFAVLLAGLELGDNTANRIAPILASEIAGLQSFDRVVIELGGSGAVDNIVYTPVPEPSTAVLLAIGLLGLAVAGRAPADPGR